MISVHVQSPGYSLVVKLHQNPDFVPCRTCYSVFSYAVFLRPWTSDCHLSSAVGGDALLPHPMLVGGLRWVMNRSAPPHSSASVHSTVWLAKEVRPVLCTLLPLVGVARSSGGAMHRGGGGGGAPRGGHLPVHVVRRWFPGFEGWAG